MAKNILICDDAAFMRMMIKDILSKNGYNIAGEAENGVKAVEKYNETKPDLVLMDITMPEMDGIQALKKIKEADPNACVIMCSAMGQQAMVIEAIQSGAKDFIVKPFQAERVLEAVKKVVGQYDFIKQFIIQQLFGINWCAYYLYHNSGYYLLHDKVDWKLSESTSDKQEPENYRDTPSDQYEIYSDCAGGH